jgi:Ser-tRNA(Ala) deacylase AlaX
MTKLLYLEDFNTLEAVANVVGIVKENDKDIVVLDQTVFYPQGGGQPYDQGIIESLQGKFIVEETRFADGLVSHIGRFKGDSFHEGEVVGCLVDGERRKLNARIHSAGHLVDKAIAELDLGWIPGKGYHFPNGPYDEYEGSLEDLDKEKVKADIERLCNECIQRGGKTQIVFMEREEMKKVCHYVPDFPEEKGKRARIVVHDGYYMPCGGTPVANISEVERMTIRKIKQEGKNIRIGYDVAR